MTRQHNSQFYCPNCRTFHTSETPFGRWIRENPQLDSGLGYSVTDQDYWVHKFKTHEQGREFQLIMGIEIKLRGADLSPAQRDSYYIVDQIMRNRRDTPTKKSRRQAGSGPMFVWSTIAGKEVYLRAYGMHVLTFSGLGPYDSEVILWDKKPVTLEVLTSIIAFDLDPDTLKPIDLRSHHRQRDAGDMPLLLYSAEEELPTPDCSDEPQAA